MKEISRIVDHIKEEQGKDVLNLPPEATSLEVHQAIYRNPALPISTRQRSATAGLPFEFPKLAVQMNVNNNFAEELEAVIGLCRLLATTSE
jgi:hypothetical protein